jgi:hypothetical protein
VLKVSLGAAMYLAGKVETSNIAETSLQIRMLLAKVEVKQAAWMPMLAERLRNKHQRLTKNLLRMTALTTTCTILYLPRQYPSLQSLDSLPNTRQRRTAKHLHMQTSNHYRRALRYLARLCY